VPDDDAASCSGAWSSLLETAEQLKELFASMDDDDDNDDEGDDGDGAARERDVPESRHVVS
jgi:hypothetical protein